MTFCWKYSQISFTSVVNYLCDDFIDYTPLIEDDEEWIMYRPSILSDATSRLNHPNHVLNQL